VGAGHVSRSHALALALSAHRPVVMVLDRGGVAWKPKLESKDLQVEIEGEEPPGPWCGCVLDSYEISRASAVELAERAGLLAVIDDRLEPPPCADLVINPAPGLTGNQVNGVPALLGPRYALLGPRYSDPVRGPAREIVAHVVVTFGGRDSWDATGLTVQALGLLGSRDFEPKVTVVMGSAAPHLAAVRQAVMELGPRATIKVDESDMPSLLRTADLVIGGGGVSLLERMACGLPSVTVVTAANQRRAVQGAAELGVTQDVGLREDLDPEALANAVEALVKDRERRTAMAVKARRSVDGRGSARVAKVLVEVHRQRRGSRPQTPSLRANHGGHAAR